MNIIELAKEMLQRKVYLGAMGFECTDAQLEAFATAITENYKAGLVPVSFTWDDDGVDKYTNDTDYVGSLSKHIFITPLYALGETK